MLLNTFLTRLLLRLQLVNLWNNCSVSTRTSRSVLIFFPSKIPIDLSFSNDELTFRVVLWQQSASLKSTWNTEHGSIFRNIFPRILNLLSRMMWSRRSNDVIEFQECLLNVSFVLTFLILLLRSSLLSKSMKLAIMAESESEITTQIIYFSDFSVVQPNQRQTNRTFSGKTGIQVAS